VTVEAAERATRPWWDQEQIDAPLILAIDSSSRTGSLAVLKGHAVVAEASWTAHGPGGSLHLDLATRLLADHGLTLSQLHGVVVATGPGSFTGVRAGISVGQGLAEALSIPLIGVPTLDGLVAQIAGLARPGDLVCAIVSAGRGAIHAWTVLVQRLRATRLYEACGDPVTASIEEVAVALGVVGQATRRRIVIGGEVDSKQARLYMDLVPRATVLSPTETQRRAAWLAGLARPALDAVRSGSALLNDTRVLDVRFPEAVQPVYLSAPTGSRSLDLGWRVPLKADHSVTQNAVQLTE
jgi:tRNA threonylcarbamoyl adenosine modification protein YeaZ